MTQNCVPNLNRPRRRFRGGGKYVALVFLVLWCVGLIRIQYSSFVYILGPNVYRESICKEIAGVANASLKGHVEISDLPNARRFIVAWGLHRGNTIPIMRFLADGPFVNFAKPTNHPNPHAGRYGPVNRLGVDL